MDEYEEYDEYDENNEVETNISIKMTEDILKYLGIKRTNPNELSTNPAYARRIFTWLFLRDAIEGEATIKFKNELYLPMPSGMLELTPATSVTQRNYYSQLFESDTIKRLFQYYNPNFHPNPAYAAYLTRAQFPELPGYVLRGLLGLAMKKPPEIALPPEMEYLLENATTNGLSLGEYFMYLLEENLTMGRIGTAFDVSEEDGRIYFAPYIAESILNWKTAQRKGEDEILKSVRLEEYDPENYDDDAMSFASYMDRDKVIEMHMLDGTCICIKYEKNEDPEIRIPSYMGNTFPFIPFIAIGSLNNLIDIDPAPIHPIATNAQHIYMKSADLSQSQFMSCSPMLVVSGATEEEIPKAIGSTVALVMRNPEAKAYFLKTDTSALSHVKSTMQDLYQEAINMGAQLLDTSPKPAETAETTRLKQAASTATVLTSIRNITEALVKQLKQIARIVGANEDEIKFIPNTKFIAPIITAAEIRELVQSWMNGAISHVTLLENFKESGIVHESSSAEEEINKIRDEEVLPGSPKDIRLNSLANSKRGQKVDTTQQDNNGDRQSQYNQEGNTTT